MATAKSLVRGLKTDKDLCIKTFGVPFDELAIDEDTILSNRYNAYKKDINIAFYKKVIEKKGVILKETPEAKTSERYLEAMSNYTAVYEDINKNLIKDYENNLLEEDANDEGLCFSNYYMSVTPF